MAKKQKSTSPPTPAEMQAAKDSPAKTGLGFDDVLRHLALGMSPTAPRLPEQALGAGTMFGGYPKGISRIGNKTSLSFAMLRQIAVKSPLLAAIISRRKHQTVRHARVARKSKKGEVGFRVTHKRAGEKDFKIPEGFQNLMRECEDMILKPWQVYWNDGVVFQDVEPTFAGFMSKVTDDLLVINRPVIELGLDPLRVPRAFGAVDGANIIPTFQALKYLTKVNRDLPPDFQNSNGQYAQALQRASDKFRVDLDERTEYIYMLNGKPVTGYRHDELIVAPQFPSTDVRTAGYPSSLTEIAVHIILAEILAMQGNSRYFEFGQMTETILTLKGAANDQHVKDLKSILQGNMTGIQGMYRIPLIATPNGKDDLEVVQLKENHRDMLFDVYIQKLTNLACAVFSMHPSEINEAPRAGDNSGGINQSNQTQQVNMAQEQGLEATLEHTKISVMDPMLQRIDPDLTFEWEYGQSESEQLDITTKYGPITKVNERRAMMGLDPLSDKEGGNVIDNNFIQARNTQQQQSEQAAAAGAPGAPGAKAGQPGGRPDGGDEDGAGDGEEEDSSEDDDSDDRTDGGKKRPQKGGKVDYENESPKDRIKRLVAGAKNSA